jgi:hypothetical protein
MIHDHRRKDLSGRDAEQKHERVMGMPNQNGT